MDRTDFRALPALAQDRQDRSLDEWLRAALSGSQGPRLVLDGSRPGLEKNRTEALAEDAESLSVLASEQWESLPTPSRPWGTVLLLLAGGPCADPELWRRLARSADGSTRIVVLDWVADRNWDDPSTHPVSRQHLLAALAAEGFRVQKGHDLTPSLATSPSPPHTLELLELRFDGHRVREMCEDDLPSLLDLFAVSFHHPRSEAHWRWKYEHNPWGAHRVTVIESPQNEVVGQYCAYPVPVFDGASQSRRLCHQVGDTMTARSVRSVGRGPTSLLARSARHFYARHCDHAIDLNFGFNTGNIQKFSRLYVGAQRVFDAPYLERDLEGTRLPQRSLRQRILKRYRVEAIDELTDPVARQVDDLFQQVAPDYGILVERRARYLRWRYLDCPDADYRLYLAWREDRLVGWSVFRRREAEGDRPARLVWGDALVRPDDAEACVELVARATAEMSAPRLTSWFSTVPGWWQGWLEVLGLERQPEPDGLGMVVVPFCWSDPVEDLQQRYYCTMGDCDLF